jgi:hypothetical protein
MCLGSGPSVARGGGGGGGGQTRRHTAIEGWPSAHIRPLPSLSRPDDASPRPKWLPREEWAKATPPPSLLTLRVVSVVSRQRHGDDGEEGRRRAPDSPINTHSRQYQCTI